MYGGVCCIGGGNKRFQEVVASMNTVTNVTRKVYATHSPSNGGGKRNYFLKAKGLYNNKVMSNSKAWQFLCSMHGDDCELNLGVVQDILYS
ncbi:hypothetical protein FRX31_018225 [Thalictrum thalictroides]|uniref:Uncharacterized protein n=1 Tax=Thalictrum thalictroides TaxID=46969 RepID=A0A7J6W5H1_THATH|nr:hypothetical protein FRX31_018225 [Thalictrum thalictroides]